MKTNLASKDEEMRILEADCRRNQNTNHDLQRQLAEHKKNIKNY